MPPLQLYWFAAFATVVAVSSKFCLVSFVALHCWAAMLLTKKRCCAGGTGVAALPGLGLVSAGNPFDMINTYDTH